MIGLTCHAIADLMRKHINISATFAFSSLGTWPVEVCITWARTQIDIRCLSYILKTAGAEDLLVPKWKFSDQPLGWYISYYPASNKT
jgi:hypothetical protein